jgi:hypothetical protein
VPINPNKPVVLLCEEKIDVAYMAQREDAEELAALIVRAVNAHDALVEVCHLAISELSWTKGARAIETELVIARIRAALALAKDGGT